MTCNVFGGTLNPTLLLLLLLNATTCVTGEFPMQTGSLLTRMDIDGSASPRIWSHRLAVAGHSYSQCCRVCGARLRLWQTGSAVGCMMCDKRPVWQWPLLSCCCYYYYYYSHYYYYLLLTLMWWCAGSDSQCWWANDDVCSVQHLWQEMEGMCACLNPH